MAKIGRPTEYKKEFCEQIIEHCKTGLSFEAFAGEIGVSKDSLYEWVKVYPEFSDAKKKALDCARLYWEKLGRDHIINDGKKSLNSAVWIFNMKNRFSDQWREKTETEISGNPIQINIQKEDEDL